jgi:hypothetical protein
MDPEVHPETFGLLLDRQIEIVRYVCPLMSLYWSFPERSLNDLRVCLPALTLYWSFLDLHPCQRYSGKDYSELHPCQDASEETTGFDMTRSVEVDWRYPRIPMPVQSAAEVMLGRNSIRKRATGACGVCGVRDMSP